MPGEERSRRSGVIPLALLAGLAFALYVPSLSGSFLLDDDSFISNNPYVTEPASWLRFLYVPASLTADERQERMMYRPLTALSDGISYSLGGANPFWYHFVSASLHAANTGMVYCLALRMLGGVLPAAVAALLFCLHPAQVESVAYVTGRSGLLSLFFCLAALLLYLPSGGSPEGGTRRGLLACGAFALAMLSKESAVFLAPVLAAHDLTLGAPAESWRSRLRRWTPYLAVLGGYLTCRRVVLGCWGQRRGLWGGGWIAHAGYMSHGLFQDLATTLWPARLSVCYSFRQGPRFGIEAAAMAAVLFGVAGLSLLLLRRRCIEGFASFWYLCGLAPVSNLLPMIAFSDDRFLYAPLVGVALLCGSLSGRLWDGITRRWARGAMLGAIASLCLFSAYRALAQELSWQGQTVLDLGSYERRPGDPCTCLRVGRHYLDWGMPRRAETFFEAALERGPGVLDQSAWMGLASARMARGEYREADALLRRALAINPDRRDLHRLIAECARGMGDRVKERRELMLEAAVSRPPP